MEIDMLSEQIEKIGSDKVKRFVLLALMEVDPKFWIAPCSSTGKYHPPEDNGIGGIIRHLIKGTAVVEQFARRANFSPLEQDLAIASYLLHDICKDGMPWGEYTDYTHGLIAYNWLQQFRLDDEYAKQTILEGVRYHMAPWCYAVSPFRKEGNFTKDEMLANIAELTRALVAPSRVELAVREADYWSSRETMSYMPGYTIVQDKRVIGGKMVHDSPKKWLEQLSGLSAKVNQA
jgi:hypothetical protein